MAEAATQVATVEHWRRELDAMVPEWGALFPGTDH